MWPGQKCGGSACCWQNLCVSRGPGLRRQHRPCKAGQCECGKLAQSCQRAPAPSCPNPATICTYNGSMYGTCARCGEAGASVPARQSLQPRLLRGQRQSEREMRRLGHHLQRLERRVRRRLQRHRRRGAALRRGRSLLLDGLVWRLRGPSVKPAAAATGVPAGARARARPACTTTTSTAGPAADGANLVAVPSRMGRWVSSVERATVLWRATTMASAVFAVMPAPTPA